MNQYIVMKLDLPCMLYQGRRYAYKKVQRMDPSSIQRGVRQFKTYMSLKLDQVTMYLNLWCCYYPFLTVAEILASQLSEFYQQQKNLLHFFL